MGIALTPEEIGLPAKFSEWRPGQDNAVDRMIDAFGIYRFVAMSAPVGAGKTGSYIAVALAMGWRVCVVTSTKGLQDQLLGDFAEIGLVDVRGRNNFECGLSDGEPVSCEDGLHMRCNLRQKGHCEYGNNVKIALAGRLVTTNYKYWMLSHLYGDGLGKFDLLVLDEAHEAPEEVCAAKSVSVWGRDVGRLLQAGIPSKPLDCDISEWREWAQLHLPKAEREIEACKELSRGSTLSFHASRLVRDWTRLYRTLTTLATATGPWACMYEPTKWGSTYRFEPLWARDHAKGLLFLDVPRVLLASATITPKTIDLMGIKRDEVDFQQYPYLFPIRRSPIIHIPTVMVKHDMTDDDRAILESRIDQIVGTRLDRKGLIHTVSYKLGKAFKDYCLHNDVMDIHERSSEATREAVRQFRLAPPPRVLLSPSIGTGLDFPYCLAPGTRALTADLRWQDVADFAVGDYIAGFDETAEPGYRSRHYRTAMVTNVDMIHRPCYRLEFEDGTEVTSSAEHKWLVYRNEQGQWITTENLRCGEQNASHVCKLMDTWKERTDWDAGYLAGVLDGEGFLTQRLDMNQATRGKSTGLPVMALGFAQKNNACLVKAEECLIRGGYKYQLYDKSDLNRAGVYNVQVTQRARMLRLLGEVRPARLLSKFTMDMVGSLRSTPLRLVKKTAVGEQLVVALGTTTGTLIAEGIATHNSDAEYQIIPKLPFVVIKGNPIMEARCRKKKGGDPSYADYLMVQALTQQFGRTMRAQDDRSETFILDDNFFWVRRKLREHFPAWVWPLLSKMDNPPSPPPPLERAA